MTAWSFPIFLLFTRTILATLLTALQTWPAQGPFQSCSSYKLDYNSFSTQLLKLFIEPSLQRLSAGFKYGTIDIP